MKKTILWGILVGISLLGCSSSAKSSPADILSIPAKQTENFTYNLSLDLPSRIQKAPDVLMDYLKKMDSTDRYSPYLPSVGERNLVTEYLGYLPDATREVMRQKCIGIYFINNFIGGGMTDYVFDRSGTMYVYMILNPALLKIPLSEWIKYRDNSSFHSEGITYMIDNTTGSGYLALIHTLLHESVHVYDYFRHLTPYVETHLAALGIMDTAAVSFIRGVWSDYSLPVPGYDFKHRTEIGTYGLGKPLSAQLIPEIYANLAKTPFTSLYASQSWEEDLAETFTWFWLRETRGIKYEMTIHKDAKLILTYSPTENEIARSRYDRLREIMR